MRTIIAIVVLLALSAAGFAAKVTVDPNVPGASPAVEKPDDVDARLAEKITYIAKGKTISAILDDLTKSTGITFRAGYNSGDWQVRDRKMTISVTDVPISRLMSSMARVMKFKWRQLIEDGEYSYRFYLDKKTELDIEAEYSEKRERAEADRNKKRTELVEQYSALADLSEKEMLSLKQTNPYLYMIAQTGIGKPLSSFFQQLPAAHDAFLKGDTLELQGSDLPSEVLAITEDLIARLAPIRVVYGEEDQGTPVEFDRSYTHISINDENFFLDGPMFFKPVPELFLGTVLITRPDARVSLPFFDHEGEIAQIMGTLFNDIQEYNTSIDDLFGLNLYLSKFTDAAFKARMEAEFYETAKEPAADPTLEEMVELKCENPTALVDAQLALAEASGLGVVSDYFYAIAHNKNISEKAKIITILKKLCEQCYYNCDKQGDMIEFHSRAWYTKRKRQLPEAQLDAWRDETIKTGTLDWNSLSQITALDKEVYLHNIRGDEILEYMLGSFHEHRDDSGVLVKFGSLLTTEQRTALLSTMELDLSSLNKQQFMWVQRYFSDTRGLFGKLSVGQGVLKCTREKSKQDKSIKYTFTLTLDGEVDDCERVLTTPVRPPEEVESANQQTKKPANNTKETIKE